ncbi:MAG: MFS transporter [Gammaproteobacteria bacterium]|nr:MFS transporter [Gammaproteobacteria bacterium]
MPILLLVKERKPVEPVALGVAIRQGLRQLLHTFHTIRNLKVVFTFLLAYWLYIDGVDTISVMAGDYGSRVGFDQGDLIMAFLMTQFVAFPAAIAYGKLGEKIGAKAAILIAIAIYIGVTVYGYFMNDVKDFYILAIVIGLVQGGIQSLSRSLYARLIPADKSAEFFGFYNMLGKLATAIGPLLMAVVSHFSANPRLSILSLIILFILGAVLLTRVNEAEGIKMAHALENQA